MDNRITRRSNNSLRSKNTSTEVKYRIGMTVSLLLISLALFFDLMELALSLISGGLAGYVKDFASIFIFPFLFWAFDAPFWKGNKRIQKLITMATAFVISLVPYLSDVLPELLISVVMTLMYTRMEDRIKHFKNRRLDSSLRSRRGAPASDSEEDEEEEEPVQETITRLRREPVHAPNSLQARNTVQNPSVRNTPPLRQTPSIGNSRPQQAFAGSNSLRGADTNSNTSNISRDIKINEPAQAPSVAWSNATSNSSGIHIPPMRRVISPPNSVSMTPPPSLPQDLPSTPSMSPDVSIQDIANSANYQGDWTLLLRDRMRDPVTKQKFIDTRTEAMPEMKQGEPGQFDKSKTYASHYIDQIKNYDQNVAKVFDSTEIGNANKFNSTPSALGVSTGIGKTGAVFDDAESKRKSLTDRQKNIVEAHEKGHGLRDFHSPKDQNDFKNSIDRDVLDNEKENGQIKNTNYLHSAEEIAERMGQLKNYFGFKAGETFTKQHLDHARKHYLSDTGLDNDMSSFLNAITPKTEAKFLETMNKYPI